jgi:tellurite resistance protein TerC
MMTAHLTLWVGFSVFVVVMLTLDLGLFHRKARSATLHEAAIWTVVWVALALIFNTAVYFMLGPQLAGYFLVGYLIEWSLSMDNVFVFAVIFSYFVVPRDYQHRVLFWGILGAVCFRLGFGLAGAELLERFHWTMYVFGAFLVFTGFKLMRDTGAEVQPERNPVLRLARRWLPVTEGYEYEKFFVRRNGRLLVTPLFLVLLVVETTDVVFAVDSVPAIFGIFPNPREADIFIVFTSNVFAILGLRALYFLLAGVMGMFRYLSKGLAVILCFVGFKMLLADVLEAWSHVPHDALMVGSLIFIVMVLAVSIIASVIVTRLERRRDALALESQAQSEPLPAGPGEEA